MLKIEEIPGINVLAEMAGITFGNGASGIAIKTDPNAHLKLPFVKERRSGLAAAKIPDDPANLDPDLENIYTLHLGC